MLFLIEGPVAVLTMFAAGLIAAGVIYRKVSRAWRIVKGQIAETAANTSSNGRSIAQHLEDLDSGQAELVRITGEMSTRLERGDQRFDEHNARLSRIEGRIEAAHQEITRTIEEAVEP